ncbi:hypothetical protein E4T56_gene13214 [Termitomyces sp. T112]|nr:hypothetical protein E4T56_gene13214 [Termitomyces sp. T112]
MAGFAAPAFVVVDLDGPALAAADFGSLALAAAGLNDRATSPGTNVSSPLMSLAPLGAEATLLIAGGAMSLGTKPSANAAKPPNLESELLSDPPPS